MISPRDMVAQVARDAAQMLLAMTVRAGTAMAPGLEIHGAGGRLMGSLPRGGGIQHEANLHNGVGNADKNRAAANKGAAKLTDAQRATFAAKKAELEKVLTSDKSTPQERLDAHHLMTIIDKHLERANGLQASAAPKAVPKAKASSKQVLLKPVGDVSHLPYDPFGPMNPIYLKTLYGDHQFAQALGNEKMSRLARVAEILMYHNKGTKPTNKASKASLIQYIQTHTPDHGDWNAMVRASNHGT